MTKEKKQPHKVVMTEGKREIIRSLKFAIQSLFTTVNYAIS